MASNADATPAQLDYLGKTHSTLLACGRSANRSFSFGVVLNLTYLAFLLGSVSFDPEIGLGGFKLSPSPLVLIVAIHWISTFVLAHGWAAAIAEFNLLQGIRRSYHMLGVSAAAEEAMESPLILPGVTMIIAERFTHVKRVGRFAGNALQFAFLIATLALPIVVQVCGTIKVWNSQAGAWWVAILVASGLVTLSYVEVAWHHIKRLEDKTFVPE